MYLGVWQISSVERFCENNEWFLDVGHLHKIDSSLTFDMVLNTYHFVMTMYGWFSLINEKRYMFFKSSFYLLSSRTKQRTTRRPTPGGTTTTSTRTTSTTTTPTTITTTTTSTTKITSPTTHRPAGQKLRKRKERSWPRSQITATYYTHTLSFL